MAIPDLPPARSLRPRLTRIMRVAAALAIVIAALAVVLVARGEVAPRILLLIATALGISLVVLLGTAWMTITFLRGRRGHEADAGAPHESERS